MKGHEDCQREQAKKMLEVISSNTAAMEASITATESLKDEIKELCSGK